MAIDTSRVAVHGPTLTFEDVIAHAEVPLHVVLLVEEARTRGLSIRITETVGGFRIYVVFMLSDEPDELGLYHVIDDPEFRGALSSAGWVTASAREASMWVPVQKRGFRGPR